MKNTKHILFMLDYYLPHQGGAEKLFSHLVSGLIREGNKVTIITTKHSRSLPSKEISGNLTILRKGSSRISLLRRGIILGIKAMKTTPDLIHTTSYAGAFPARILSKLYKKPITITIHELFGSLWDKLSPKRSRLRQRYERFMVTRTYTKIIAVSQYTRQSIEHHTSVTTPVDVIYNGIDNIFLDNHVQRSQPSFHKVFYFGHCGLSKGIDKYVEYLPSLYKQFPQTSFTFNLLPSKNTPHIRRHLQELSKTIPITIYNGLSQQDLIKEIQQSSFVVVPSRSEGFGLAAAEVCALGVSLLTTKYGALPEVVSGKHIFFESLEYTDFLSGRKRMIAGSFEDTPKKEFDREVCFKQYNQIRNKSIIE